MSFNVLAVCENGEENFPLYPTLNDEIHIMGEALDGGFGETIQVSKVIVRRKVGNSFKTVTETKDLSFQVWVTASRVVFYCKKFEKGGGWMGWGVGGLAVAIVANSVSHAIAANRRKGKALVGNIRYPWVSRVSFAPRSGMGTENQVRISFADGTEDSRPDCDITLYIERHRDANTLARHITDRVIAYRYASGEELDADQLAGFEALRTSGLVAAPAKGYLSSYEIPSSWRVPIGMTNVPAAAPAFPPVPPVPPAGSGGGVAEVPTPSIGSSIGSPKVVGSAFCESCGSPELGERFCTDCGAPRSVTTRLPTPQGIVTMAATPEQRALAAEPSTDAQTLANLAYAEHDLWPAIAAHPNAYPDLIGWMRDNGLPDASGRPAPVMEVPSTTSPEPVAADAGPDASGAPGAPAKLRPRPVVMAAIAGVVVAALAVGAWLSYTTFIQPHTSDHEAGVGPTSAIDYRFGAEQSWRTHVNLVEPAQDDYAARYATLQSYPGLWLVSWPGSDSGTSGRLGSETLLGLDPETGATKWSMSPGPYTCASQLAAGLLACVDTSKAIVQLLDPSTGKTSDSSLNGTPANSVNVFHGDILLGYESSITAGVVDTLERVTPNGTVVWNKSNTCTGYKSDAGMQFSTADELNAAAIAQADVQPDEALLQGVCLSGTINLESGSINANASVGDDGCEQYIPFGDSDGLYAYGDSCVTSRYPMLIARGGSTLTAITMSAYQNDSGADESDFPTLWTADLTGAELAGKLDSVHTVAHLGAYAVVASAGNLYGVDTERGPTWEKPGAFASDGQVLLLPIDSTKPNSPILALDLAHDTIARLDPSSGATRVSAEPTNLPECPTSLTPVSFSTWDSGAGATLVCQGFGSTVTVILIVGGKTYTSATGSITPTGYHAVFSGNVSVDIGLGGWAAWVTDGSKTSLHAATSGWKLGDARASRFPALARTVRACPVGTFPLSLSTWNGGWLLTCGQEASAITRFVYIDGSAHGSGNAMSTQGGQSCGTDSAGIQVCVNASPAVVTFSSGGATQSQHSADANYVVGRGFSGAGQGTGAYGLADPTTSAASQVAYLNGILQQSQAARASIRTVVQNILKCTSVQADVQSAQTVVAARTTELQALTTAPVDAVPGGAALVSQLRAVLQDSLTADQAYVTAANQVAGGQCPAGKATYNAQKALINQITSEKSAFVNAWNGQIAGQYGMPTYTQDDI